jgi:hypothetical protein
VSDPVSEPGEEIEALPPPIAPKPRRIGTPVLVAAVAVVLVIGAIGATPFWAPALMRFLPWGPPATTPHAAATEPALAAMREEAGRNAAALQLLGQRVAAIEARPGADLSPLQQQLTALTKSTADLTRSVVALEKAAQAQPAADPSLAALALVLLQIRDAVELGRPFEPEYQALVALARDHHDIAAAAAPLAGPAERGVATHLVLGERLRQLAPQIATAKPPPKATWKSQIVAQLRKLVTIRRIDGDAQTPAEAAVGTAQRDMASGDLAGAVEALDTLGAANQAVAEPWLRMAKQRLAVEAALRQVTTTLTAALAGAAPAGKG